MSDLTRNDRRALALVARAGGASSVHRVGTWSAAGWRIAQSTVRRLINRGLVRRLDDTHVALTGEGETEAESHPAELYLADRRNYAGSAAGVAASDSDDRDLDAPVALGRDGLPVPADEFFRRSQR